MKLARMRRWIDTHFNLKKFSVYLAGGVVSYLINIGVTFVLVELLNLHYILSFIIALTISTIVNFFLNAKVIFKVKERYLERLFLHALSVIVFSFLSVLFVKLLVDGLSLHYTIGITVATGVIFLIKFFWYDKFVFGERKKR